MKKFPDLSSWSRWSLSLSRGAVIGSVQHVIASTKCVAISLVLLALLAGCDDSSSALAENSEPAALSSAEKQGSSSSGSVSSAGSETSSSSRCTGASEECDEAISSDSNAESSSSEKLSGASSSSAGKAKSSSSENSSSSAMETITSSDGSVYDSSSNTLTDLRDGLTYKTVKIGTQTWMAENLNFKTDSSFCHDDKETDCTEYGRLYRWAAAVGKSESECGYGKTCSLPSGNIRGVCPSGWHLPSKAEWETLFNAVGGQSTAGKVLKSTSGWNNSGDGTDAFSFSALPVGYRSDHGSYFYEGIYALFWSSTERNNYYADNMYLYYNHDNADLGGNYKYNGLSVRCLKD